MARLDIDAIRAQTDIAEVVTELAGPLITQRGGEPRFRCTRHGEDRHPSGRVNVGKQTYYCDVCREGGDVFRFVQRYCQYTFHEATRFLATRAGISSAADRPSRCRNSSRPSQWHGHPIATWYDYENDVAVARVETVVNGERKKDFPVWACGSWGLKGKVVARRLFNQRALASATDVFVLEGEKDVETLTAMGLAAVSNLGGANKWQDSDTAAFGAHHHVVVVPDNDEVGRAHAAMVAKPLARRVASVKVLELPDLPDKGDITDWVQAQPDLATAADALSTLVDRTDVYGDDAELASMASATSPDDVSHDGQSAVTVEDFYAYMPMHTYLFVPSRESWPAASVNARVPPVPLDDEHGAPVLDDDGNPETMKASAYLDRQRPVEQMTWIPGQSMLIRDRLVSEGGWIEHHGCTTFNLYRPPCLTHGNPAQSGPWVDHLRAIYPEEADHLIAWLAHRVQRPADKINHALVLGGPQGIGKDTLLEPVKAAIGPWNFSEVSPGHLLGRFNGFVKSVILRISEGRDLGEVNRFTFYDHLKTYTAAPPDVLRVDEKHLREYAVWNVCGVIITTNHRTDGLYLPADDRRHYVAWSERTKEEFSVDYWNRLYRWYSDGGIGHVAAYLAQYDLSTFEAKAPPPKTAAFFAIVDASRAPEDAELADALDRLSHPPAVTLDALAGPAPTEFSAWLTDRRNARQVPHRLEAVGYVAVRNPAARDGLWKINGRRQAVYARHDLCLRDQVAAAEELRYGGR